MRGHNFGRLALTVFFLLSSQCDGFRSPLPGKGTAFNRPLVALADWREALNVPRFPTLKKLRPKPLVTATPAVRFSDSQSSSSSNFVAAAPFDPWLLAIVACAVCWGLNFPVQSLAFTASESEASSFSPPPGTFAFLRFIMSSAALLPFCVPEVLRAKSVEEDVMPVVKDGLIVGFCLAGGYIGQIVGLGAGEPGSEACFVCSLQVVVVTLLQALREKKLTAKAGASTALAVTGVALLEGMFDPSVSVGVGVIPLLMQPIFFGLTYLVISDAMSKRSYSALAFTTSQLTRCAVFCGIYGFLFEGDVASSVSKVFEAGWGSPSILALLYSSILGTSASIALEVKALQTVSSRDCAVILTAEPLVAAAGGALILGEGFDHWFAALLILGASAVTFIAGDSNPKEE
mmetsp:Transcript_2759/g.5301  ORF Transcript_2759/g.5301 Transcript_2759/m.5301 type:complete len:403 (-) Transcript_2759:94-1302(-)|eukprot:CAMPEP_0182471924 /NCGR_PEP_ID=MMETSP1319-20130603/21238_1 /TAXON_ID=172717 /ORGANISM="Bolidomonas pacifica, Strain RCC208" /LENGTH=402 /DNA_ID=CAMNT_0024672535 /DNA_START=97 /DNA_END=1305 /DNA_ORIENTATION=+